MRFPLRAVVFSSVVCMLVSACGGGGGGGDSTPPPPPVNTTPPTATISAITPTQRVVNQSVSFTGSGTTATGGALTYAWNFGDGGTATGTSATHDYTTHGNFTVTLRVTDAGGLATSVTQAITLVAPPATPAIVIGAGNRTPNTPISFTANVTDPQGSTLTYSWDFGDATTGTGATPTHTYTTPGTFNAQVVATNSFGLTATSASVPVAIAWLPPTTPTIAISGGNRVPNTPVSFSASATDPQGGAVTYAWDFGDGTIGTGATPTHTYTAPGTFQARVTATNAVGLSTPSAATPVAVAWLPPGRPSLIVYNDGHLLGQTLFAGASFIEPNGLPYVLEWNFGDSATATSTDSYATVHHTYAAAGTYTVRLTATGAGGVNESFTRTVTVQAPLGTVTLADNVLQPYCAGPFCSASDPTTYSGHGLGIWRYHNATNTDATINVAISGVHPDVAASLVFSNGKATAAASVPGPGTASVPPDKLAKAGVDTPSARAHAAVQAQNRRLASALTRVNAAPGTSKQTRAVVQAAAPPVGTTRAWRETSFTNQTFTLTVAATCTFSTGRNGVIWVDAAQLQSGELEAARITALTATLCGANGAYERLVALTGDLWGANAASTPNYIQDTPVLQDLHIVIPGLDQNHSWNGYFSAGNLVNSTADPNSNAALAVVLNGWVFAHYPNDDPATRNTLIHELKHLANFYQRAISRGAYHSVFLEETSAMMAEDLVSPLTTPQSRTEARVGGYAFGGAGVGYIGWTHSAGGSYNLGGSFGTFLHRRYGSSLDRELITMCTDNGTPESSYDCVNDYIVRHGGTGFEDEFARLGATTLGMMYGTQLPRGFGLPGVMVDDVPLKPIGNYMTEGPFNTPPADLNGTFGATTQTFLRDYLDAGQTTFRRDNVVVPSNTTLLVVVSEQLNF